MEFASDRFLDAQSRIFGLYALAIYDLWRNNTTPSLNVSVNSGNLTLISTAITSQSTGGLSLAAYFEQLPSSLITINASGIGSATVLLQTEYLPPNVSSLPVSQGFSVVKFFQLYDRILGEEYGPPITSAPLGSSGLYHCSIQMILTFSS